MSNSASDRNLNIEGSADGSLVIVGDGNIINSPSNIPTSALNPFGVPYQRNRYFTGREAVLTQLHEQLTQSTATAITQVQAISGLGGIGKTQTAVEYAYRYHYDERVYDTVFWVKADTEVNLAADFAGIANQLALPMRLNSSGVTQMEKISVVQAWLATHHNWLLIFDNADTPDWLTSFMPTNPQGKVLITSRAGVFDQVGIQSPLTLGVLSSDAAIELLFERTGYERTETNIASATDLNQLLSGLPLALEQASAFMMRRRIDFSTYLKTYRKRGLSQLEKEKAKTGQYPFSVLNTWRINFEAVSVENSAASALLEISSFLAPDEIPYRILILEPGYLGDVLSPYLFPDDSDDLDDARLALCDLLALLSQYSLITWEPSRELYSIHRLVQAVVRDRLSPENNISYLERAIVSMVLSYPGQEFQHWGTCAQLLPHWLMIIQQSRQTSFDSEALAQVLTQAGDFFYGQGRYGEAESLYQESLVLRKQLLGETHSDVASSLNNLAQSYAMQGRYGEAESLYQEALTLRKQLWGEAHPDVASSLNNLAGIYKGQGRYGEAESLYQEALTLRKQLLGEDHPDVASSLNNLAGIFHSQGRYDEAEPLYQKALVLRQQLLGTDHPDVASSLNNLAGIFHSQGRYDEAEPLYQEALVLRQQLLGKSHPHVAHSLHSMAQLYAAQDRSVEAEQLYEQALTMYQELLGEKHIFVIRTLNNLAGLYNSQSRYRESAPMYARALDLSER